LNRDGVREVEAAEVGVDPAALAEAPVQLAVREVPKRSEIPGGSPVDHLADGDDPAVGLHGDVLDAAREIVVGRRPDLQCAVGPAFHR
jgi:hypothetical protein